MTMQTDLTAPLAYRRCHCWHDDHAHTIELSDFGTSYVGRRCTEWLPDAAGFKATCEACKQPEHVAGRDRCSL